MLRAGSPEHLFSICVGFHPDALCGVARDGPTALPPAGATSADGRAAELPNYRHASVPRLEHDAHPEPDVSLAEGARDLAEARVAERAVRTIEVWRVRRIEHVDAEFPSDVTREDQPL